MIGKRHTHKIGDVFQLSEIPQMHFCKAKNTDRGWVYGMYADYLLADASSCITIVSLEHFGYVVLIDETYCAVNHEWLDTGGVEKVIAV